MVNSQTVRLVNEAFKLDNNVDKFPQIIPVVEVNPRVISNGFVRTQSLTNATSGLLMAAPSDKDMYIVAASLHYVRDATATSTLFAIQITNELGETQNLITLAGVTLNAGTMQTNMIFPHPIKVMRGTNINITSGTNVANFKCVGNISYYLDEVS